MMGPFGPLPGGHPHLTVLLLTPHSLLPSQHPLALEGDPLCVPHPGAAPPTSTGTAGWDCAQGLGRHVAGWVLWMLGMKGFP